MHAADAVLGWNGILPKFAAFLAETAVRAARLQAASPLTLAIDPGRLGEGAYRTALVGDARAWRGSRRTPTVYFLAYSSAVPSSLLDPIVDDAEGYLKSLGNPRAFPQREGRADSRCLYVGHSLAFDRRLRDHLGDGAAKTSSLNLRHWGLHPDGLIDVHAYDFADDDRLLARMFEEYLWDALRPVLGRRGGR